LFLLILTMVAAVTFAAFNNVHDSALAADWVNHANAVQSEADALDAALNAGQAATLSFVLTANGRDRESARLAFASAAEHLEVGKALTRGDTGQNNEFLQMEPIVAKESAFSRALVEAFTKSGVDAARRLAVARDAEPGLAELRAHVSRLKETQMEFLRLSDKRAFELAEVTRAVVITGAVLNILILVFTLYLIRRDLASRRRAASILEDSNKHLEATVQERTAHLVAANEALVQKNLEQGWSSQAAEHQLRFAQLILNTVSDLIIVVSRAVNISLVNPAVEGRTGFESKELVGRPLDLILQTGGADGDNKGGGSDPIRTCLKNGHDLLDSPGALLSRDGQKAPMLFCVFPLREKNKVVGGVITVRVSRQSPGAAAQPHS
jgi:PAS domain S-box-containing protein